MITADLKAKIARARVPGLIRAIAGADNRAAVARARGKAPDAVAAEEEARVLRLELEQLAGGAATVEEREQAQMMISPVRRLLAAARVRLLRAELEQRQEDAAKACAQVDRCAAELARLLALAGASTPPYTAPEQIAHRDLKPENEDLDAGAAAEAALERLAGPRAPAAGPLEELRRELVAEEAPAPRWPETPAEVSPGPAPAPPELQRAPAAVLSLRPAPAEAPATMPALQERCETPAPLDRRALCGPGSAALIASAPTRAAAP